MMGICWPFFTDPAGESLFVKLAQPSSTDKLFPIHLLIELWIKLLWALVISPSLVCGRFTPVRKEKGILIDDVAM
jgi:hypothetical protein